MDKNTKKWKQEKWVSRLLIELAVIFTIAPLFMGVHDVELGSIAVSPDERYIAYEQADMGSEENWQRLICRGNDGSLQFDISMKAFSAGGRCSIWFEGNEICVMFYRTQQVVHFTLDGDVTKQEPFEGSDYPEKYPSFHAQNSQKVYHGTLYDLIYDSQGYFGYRLFGRMRTLTLVNQNGEEILLWCVMPREV